MEVHQSHETAIKDTDGFQYWLVVFPRDKKLDSNILETHGRNLIRLRKQRIEHEAPPPVKDEDQGPNQSMVSLYWRIGVKGTSRRVSEFDDEVQV